MHHTRSDIDLRTSKEVAELLGVSVGCLLHWRQKGDGPPFARLGPRKIVYDMRDLAAWLQSRRQRQSNNSFGDRFSVGAASVQEAM
jgi:predicted DNA-binding transcriptional regulator AlpA